MAYFVVHNFEWLLKHHQPEPMSGCWIWTSALSYEGYGRCKIDGKTLCAHRVSYEMLKGEIPDGLQLDHLCRNRCCINPDHLDPVTVKENYERGIAPVEINRKKREQTECKRGHPLHGDNIRIGNGGRRICRACNKLYMRERRSKK